MTFFPAMPAPSPLSRRSADGRPVTRAAFDAQRNPDGALLVGNAEEVVEKIVRYSEALAVSPPQFFR